MTFSRYQKNNSKITEVENRENNFITHYASPQNILDKKKQNFTYSEYQWRYGDRLYKLAQKFYGDSKLWWVIAHVNLRPTDSHYSPGDILIIPNRNSLDTVIEMLGY